MPRKKPPIRLEAYRRSPSPRSDTFVGRHAKAENKIIHRLVDMPACSLSGLAFKAEVSKHDEHMSPELVASIMNDIATMQRAKLVERT